MPFSVESLQQKTKTWSAWSPAEQQQFSLLYEQYGRAFKLYEKHFNGRSYVQIKSYYYNFVNKQKRVEQAKAVQAEKEQHEMEQIQLLQQELFRH